MFFQVITILGSLASFVALILIARRNPQRKAFIFLALSLAAFACFAVSTNQKLSRINSAERAASLLLKERSSRYTNEGFIQAVLSFLEKNEKLFPDSYARALEICRQNDCFGKEYSTNSTNDTNRSRNLINVSFTLAGLVRGIATTNKGS